MTLVEAMSFSKPCVVTDVGGNSEVVVDGRTGFVTPNQNVAQFADGILKLLGNNELIKKFGLAAQKDFMQRFTLQKMVNAYQDIYLGCV